MFALIYGSTQLRHESADDMYMIDYVDLLTSARCRKSMPVESDWLWAISIGYKCMSLFYIASIGQ